MEMESLARAQTRRRSRAPKICHHHHHHHHHHHPPLAPFISNPRRLLSRNWPQACRASLLIHSRKLSRQCLLQMEALRRCPTRRESWLFILRSCLSSRADCGLVLLWTLEFAGSIIVQLGSELTRGTWKGGDSAGYTGVSSAAVNTAKARTITSTTCTTTAAAAATNASTHSVAAATRTGAINTDKTITTVRTATA
ncbi:hypothetical protein BDW71DRAFT_3115 [Aspergillus fruticulosus]